MGVMKSWTFGKSAKKYTEKIRQRSRLTESKNISCGWSWTMVFALFCFKLPILKIPKIDKFYFGDSEKLVGNFEKGKPKTNFGVRNH